MKRFLLSTALLLTFLSLPKTAKAGDLYAGSSGGPDVYTVTYTTAAIASISTNTIMVSLSSVTVAGIPVWPHPANARAIVVDSVQVENDKTAATTSVVKVGVIREINVSSGTVVWFETMNNGINVSNTNNFQNIQFYNGGLNCRVNPVAVTGGANIGATPFILSNDLTQGSATLTTGLPLVSVANGSAIYFPRVGDIIMNVANSAVASTLTVQVRYHIEMN